VVAAIVLGIVGVVVKSLLIIGIAVSSVPSSWRAGGRGGQASGRPVTPRGNPALCVPRGLSVLLCG
jgi:hypothetical protein